MPTFVMKLRRFIGRKGSGLNIDNKFSPYTHFQGYLLTCSHLQKKDSAVLGFFSFRAELVGIASVNCSLSNVQTVPSSVPISFHKDPFTDN